MQNYIRFFPIVIVFTLRFMEREYIVSEGTRSVRIELRLNASSDRNLTVQVEMIGITAEGYVTFLNFTFIKFVV